MTPADLIICLGGPAAIARALNFPGNDVGPKRVRAWAIRGTIPGAYWLPISEFAQEAGLGVTLETLASAHAIRPAEAA